MSSMRVNHRIAVVGMPGTGKSHLLNAVIKHFKCKNVERFQTGEWASAYTRKVEQRILEIPAYNEHGHVVPNTLVQLTLVDTLGWPSTDPTQTVRMYDETAKALNHADGLSAVIWVVDGERDDREMLAKYKAFMTEISMVNCKIILLVNGRENFSFQESEIADEDDPRKKEKLQKELDALKEKTRGAMHKMADTVVEQVSPGNLRGFVKLVSLDLAELSNKVPVEIHRQISDVKPGTGSAVRTFEEMALAMAINEETLQQDTRKVQSTINRLKMEKADAEWYNNAGLYGGGSAAGAVALGTLYVTSGFFNGGVTWVAGAALAGAATSGAAYAFVYDGHADEKGRELEKQKALLEDHKALLEEQQALLGNKQKMLQGAKQPLDNFKALCRFSEVDHVEFVRRVTERKVKERRQRHGA